MGFQFKPKLAALMAVINGIAVGASYIVTAGDLGVTMRARSCRTAILGVHVSLSSLRNFANNIILDAYTA